MTKAMEVPRNGDNNHSVEEAKMPEASPLPTHNMHAYLRSICMTYAQILREQDSGIRNETVYRSAISEMVRLGYAVLVKGRQNLYPGMPETLVETINRVRKFPIWVPGPKMFGSHPDGIFLDRLKPSMENGQIAWHHTP
jgi:hypothetical protein